MRRALVERYLGQGPKQRNELWNGVVRTLGIGHMALAAFDTQRAIK